MKKARAYALVSIGTLVNITSVVLVLKVLGVVL